MNKSKVIIYEKENPFDLESMINSFLETNPKFECVDIKYCVREGEITWSSGGMVMSHKIYYSALIIFNDN